MKCSLFREIELCFIFLIILFGVFGSFVWVCISYINKNNFKFGWKDWGYFCKEGVV